MDTSPSSFLSDTSRTILRVVSAYFSRSICWVAEGLRCVVPYRLQRLGLRPRHLILLMKRDETMIPDSIVERSFLGYTRRVAAQTLTDGLPITVTLPDTGFFETSISLPSAAAKSAFDAVRLRLSAISPLPPTEIVVAVASPLERGNGRIEVQVAIARASLIERISQLDLPGPLTVVAARPDSSGEFLYQFARFRHGQTTVTRKLLPLAAGAILFLGGVDVYVERWIEAESEFQDTLRRALREETGIARYVADAATVLPAVLRPTMLSDSLTTVASSLPETASLQSIEITADCTIARGQAFQDTVWPNGTVPTSVHVDHTGGGTFELRLNECASP